MLYSKQMDKKIIAFGVIVVLIIVGVLLSFRNQQGNSLITPSLIQPFANGTVLPSETFNEYSDESGFSFSYPDNISIEKKEVEDNSTYANLQLNSKDVNGSLTLNISDTKITTLDEWVKKNTTSLTPKETKLGNLKALEITLSDRLLLGALDQGVLFTIEMPLVEKDFWMKVYQGVLKDFSFAPPAQEAAQGSSNTLGDDVAFEGEEVVE